VANLEISIPSAKLRKRLFEPANYLPWVRAEEAQLSDTFLFWIPVSGFPIRQHEKEWITEFLARLSAQLEREHALRCEIFFQYKEVTAELGDSFRSYAMQCMKLMGLGRFADMDTPSFPTAAQIKEMVDSGKAIDFRDWIGDYMLWFIGKQPERQRELFLGHGGMTTTFLPPDPKIKVPKLPFTPALRASLPVFQKVDVDGIIAGTIAMQDQFLEKSKALFGAGLESKPEYPGIAFILPLLESSQFFLAPAELRAKWFQLFDVYINESRKDKGLILAFQKEEYETIMLDVLESMQHDGLTYRKEEQ
jgi:hypothetical protein